VEQEKVSAHAERLDADAAALTVDRERRLARPGVVVETAALGRGERRRDHLGIERLMETLDVGFGLRLVGGQKARDLRKAHVAVSAPDLRRTLRDEPVRRLRELRAEKRRKQQKRRVQNEQKACFSGQRPQSVFLRILSAHPLSTSLT